MQARIESYGAYGNCLHLDNGVIACVLSLEFGPRILSFRRLGGENVFYEQPKDADFLCTEQGWRVHGGTRLWLAPECVHDDYYPDNAPVGHDITDTGARLTQALDPFLGMEKSISVSFAGAADTLHVEYSLTNRSSKTLRGAPWAVSMMRPGAVVEARYGGGEQGACPSASLSLWNGTALDDARLSFSGGMLRLSHSDDARYFKLGLLCRDGEAYCRVGDTLFIKRFPYDAFASYPDNNVNLELYCCPWMLEFETLGCLRDIAPGETASHRESWTLRET